jgi:transitional endoplasmic reticulum ATPase
MNIAEALQTISLQLAAEGSTHRKGQDVEVVRSGSKVIVPDDAPLADVVASLQRRMKEEEQVVAVSHQFNLTPPEGAVAFMHALNELFGFVNPIATPGFFGDTPPQFVSIEHAPGQHMDIPLGRLTFAGISGWIQVNIDWKDGIPYFGIAGQVKGKDKPRVDKIAAAVRRYAGEHSIYRGQAILAVFPDMNDATSIGDFFPKFIDVSKADERNLIFSDEIAELVNVTLFTPIEQTKECRENNIPLKRGVLLEGPYGVGKTLTATVTAKKCTENGWTFVYIKDVRQLRKALEFARQYQPAVVFAEDLDQALQDPHRRSDSVNEILNCIDGIEAKSSEIITVLTTNNVQSITQAMLRPGRLDTVVPVRAPDAAAAERLVRLYAGERMDSTEDLTDVGLTLAGQIPAVIREVVERSKLSAVRRVRLNGGEMKITSPDVNVAAQGMFAHLKLLETKPEDKRSEREKAAAIVAGAIDRASGTADAAPKSVNGAALRPHKATQYLTD